VGIVNSSKKAYISFLMSVFLMSSIAALAYIGVFDFKNFLDMPNFVKIIAFVAVFFTLFLLIFLLFNLNRSSSRKKKSVAVNQEGNLRPLSGSVEIQEGNLRPLSGSVEIQEGNLRPLSGSVEVPAAVTRHQSGLLASASAYQRYDLSLPAGIDEIFRNDVIYEENGVPYINSDLAKRNNQGTLNSNFIRLVESVTGCLPPPVPRQQDKPDKAHKGGQG
jgi:hypothetical protein